MHKREGRQQPAPPRTLVDGAADERVQPLALILPAGQAVRHSAQAEARVQARKHVLGLRAVGRQHV
jgi:hypothetical protein